MKLHGKPVYWWVEQDRDVEGLQNVYVYMQVSEGTKRELWQLDSDHKELEKCFQWIDGGFFIHCRYRTESEIEEEREYLDSVGAKVFIPWHPELKNRVVFSSETCETMDKIERKFANDIMDAASFIAFSWMKEYDPKEILVREHHVEKAFKLLHTPFTPGTIDWRDICTAPYDETVIERIRKDPEFAKGVFAECVDILNEEGGKAVMIRTLYLLLKAYDATKSGIEFDKKKKS